MNKKIKKLFEKHFGAICFFICISGYICGLLTQIVNVFSKKLIYGFSYRISVSFNPIICFIKTIEDGLLLFIIANIIYLLYLLSINFPNKKQGEIKDERNFIISEKGTYGTARWMEEKEMLESFEVGKVEDIKGTILGKTYNGDVVALPLDTFLNQHIFVFGCSGAGKTRTFVRNQIIQSCLANISLIITDPKGEISYSASEYLREHGYIVKHFNLTPDTIPYSDSWACLKEINEEGGTVELLAQTFVNVVVENSGTPGKGDGFWDDAAKSLLKALCLFIILNEDLPDDKKNIGTVYEYLSEKKPFEISKEMDLLPNDHPAIQPWKIFLQAPEKIHGNIILGLANKLQIFQVKAVREITSHNEIDLTLPGKKKCAYFITMSDQESTFSFVSSLFFTFMFIKLVAYADSQPNQACAVPVRFVFDEFPNIGSLLDFEKKMSTIRSRGLRVTIICQGIGQIRNRYPNGLAEEIIGACDTKVFLGCNEPETAKFVSDSAGVATIKTNSYQNNRSLRMIKPIELDYKESSGEGKRNLINPDEVENKPWNEVFINVQGKPMLKLYKYDYTLHYVDLDNNYPHKLLKEHIPEWKKESLNKNKSNDKNVVEDNVEQESITIKNSSQLQNNNDYNDENFISFMKKNKAYYKKQNIDTIAKEEKIIIKKENKKEINKKTKKISFSNDIENF